MRIKDLMTESVDSLGPEATLRDVAEHMRDLDVGSIPICQNRKILGIVTDRDIVLRAIAEGLPAASTVVRQVMSGDVVCCYEEEDVLEAAERMKEAQVRRLPVINESEELVGIVALGDLAVDLHDEAMSGDVLERISEPSQPALQ